MTPVELCTAVRTLQQQGRSLRDISRSLGLSRNTVRRILRESPPVAAQAPYDAQTRVWLEEAFAQAKGNAVRIRELLAEGHGQAVSYSTLTRWLREAGLRTPPQRAGEYVFAPGQESQHDTSPHRVELAGKTVTLQCASLTLAYSRRLFIAYYTRFTRFEVKHFLLEAARFMDGTCPVCVIDNTHVVLSGGSGADAIIAPEMAAFGRALGFKFLAHRINHPDRKGRVERPFSWIEGNFLPGRHFADLDDLNRQALEWCQTIANPKTKRAPGMSPDAAYLIEKPHLQPLPAVLPPVYEVLERVVDLYGYVSVDTNRYSVPERYVGQALTVYKHFAEIKIYRRQELIATHPRLLGERNAKHKLEHHHTIPVRAPRAPAVETHLVDDPLVERYVAALKKHRPAGLRALRRLLELRRTYPGAPFRAALEQALHFGLFDLHRLERLILQHVAGDFFALDRSDEP